MHPQQDDGSAKDTEDCNQGFTDTDTDKIVNCLEIGDQMRGDSPGSQGFILCHRDALQTLQQVTADAVDDIFRNQGEFPVLPDTEDQRSKS